jgi:3-deoxy-D-manno-octulosonic-acid transferase
VVRAAPEVGRLSYTLYRTITHGLWPVAVCAAALGRAAGGAGWSERLGRTPPVSRGAVWLHAASVGEVAAVTPLARALASREHGVLLTAVTATGRNVAARSLESLTVSLAPLDFVPAVRRVLGAVSPRALLLTETELWPNTVYECSQAGVPVGMVNGRLSEKSLRRYSMAGSPVKDVASCVTFAACRTESDASRFRQLGVDGSRVTVVGDMKFDKLAVPLSVEGRAELRASLGIPADAPVVVFGSVRPREESAVAAAAAAVLAALEGSRVVVAPRHLERVPHVVGALDAHGVESTLRSSGSDGPGRAVVLNTTGELARVYAVGSVAFVGGTLAPYGGHDPLEPAAQGVPVVFGVNTETCRDSASRLKKEGAAFEVGGGSELADELLRLLRDESALAAARERALRAVEAGRGATERTLDFLSSIGVLDDAAE